LPLRLSLFVLFAAVTIGLPRPARAAAEFCPAQLVAMRASHHADAAAEYYYQLTALTPRTVSGTVIADTDRGWFVWPQPPIGLTRMTYTMTVGQFSSQYAIAGSSPMTVFFPQAVAIQRAWIVQAQTSGETLLGWDEKGMFACGVPDFGVHAVNRNETVKRTPTAADPTPPPAPLAVEAVSTPAPLSINCPNPFVAAKVTRATQPDFPASVKAAGFSQVAITEVAIAVGPDSKLIDAWVWSSSGWEALDAAALMAARRSQYAAPISYCQPVGGTYLFRAEFQPN
jgi:hypothetical protein